MLKPSSYPHNPDHGHRFHASQYDTMTWHVRGGRGEMVCVCFCAEVAEMLAKALNEAAEREVCHDDAFASTPTSADADPPR